MAQSIYKRAAQQKLRFNTSKGQLSVEQLYELAQSEDGLALIDQVAVTTKRRVDSNETDSFLKPRRNTAAVKDELRLDILKDVIETRLKAKESAEKAKQTKDENENLRQIALELDQKETREKMEKMTPEERAAFLEERGA